MRYWMTTHWPPEEGDDPDTIDPGIFLPDDREQAAARFSQGDYVFIYQSETGPIELRDNADGSQDRIACQHGRGGIVALCKIEECEVNSSQRRSSYKDGRQISWRRRARLSTISRSGFIPREEVNCILGYKPNFTLHGFGEQHAGVKELTAEQYNELITMYRKNHAPFPKPEPSSRHINLGGETESESHRKLKDYVADNPASVLGEEGLQTLGVEYPFPTQDRADIVLEDKFGHLIGVEVEVDCGPSHIVGILQAVKYRRLLEVFARRYHHEGRAMLIAHYVCPEVRAICQKYEVEVQVIDREKVLQAS